MTIEDVKASLSKLIVTDVKRMLEQGLDLQAFVMMALSIETMGAILDNKPFRAKDQALFRFNLALRKIYGLDYAKINEKNFFYQKFRCELVHLLFPSPHLKLTSFRENPAAKHLQMEDGKLTLVAEKMLQDTENALKRLFILIDKNTISQHKILLNWKSCSNGL